MEKTIIVSDWHIGNPLSNRQDINSFLKKYLMRTDAKEIILNGDIIDMLCPQLPHSMLNAIVFHIMPLLNNEVKVVYIFGNHEYEATKYGLDKYSTSELGYKGEIKFAYPVYEKTVNGENFLFTHGHLFDKVKKTIINETVTDYNKSVSNIEELDEKISSLYDFLYRMPKDKNDMVLLSHITKLDRQENLIKKIIDKFIQINPEDIEEIIDNDIKRWFQGRIDCLVYGHSHNPGITAREGKKPKVIANSGAFTNEHVEYQNTWLEIEEDIKLYRWCKEEKPIEIKRLKMNEII